MRAEKKKILEEVMDKETYKVLYNIIMFVDFFYILDSAIYNFIFFFSLLNKF